MRQVTRFARSDLFAHFDLIPIPYQVDCTLNDPSQTSTAHLIWHNDCKRISVPRLMGCIEWMVSHLPSPFQLLWAFQETVTGIVSKRG